MQRFSLPDITDIKIPRSYLQNPNNEEPLQQLLGTEASLTWIGNTIDSIKQQRPITFVITVDDSSPLNTIEETMLGAIRNYIDEHVQDAWLQARRSASLHLSSSSAIAAAAATVPFSVAAPTVDHSLSAAIAAAADATARATAAAASQTAASIALTSANISSSSAAAASTPAPLPDTPSVAAAAAAVINAADETQSLQMQDLPDHQGTSPLDARSDNTAYTPAATLAADAAVLASPLALVTDTAAQNGAAVLSVINSILKLDIWKSKGRGLLWYKLPTGIDTMQKLESPTIAGLADIARAQLAENKITRTGMTDRFYNMIIDLDQPGMTAATHEERLVKYATDEIVINTDIVNSWTVGKVVLSDNDRAALCDIIGIDNTPEAIAALVTTTQANAEADADVTLQTAPRP